MLSCQYYQQGLCRSCDQISNPVAQQLAHKSQKLKELLANINVKQYLEPVSGSPKAFRNKAKMVVSDAAHRPILGILSPSQFM